MKVLDTLLSARRRKSIGNAHNGENVRAIGILHNPDARNRAFFFRFFVLYTVYIVWEGAGAYLKINEGHRLRFTVINTAVILAAPFVIERMLGFLLPGLRI